MFNWILNFFDRVEDKIRAYLSHYPLWYALIGGAALVLFWRGVWHLADDFQVSSFGSIVLGTIVLLITGLFSSVFIGDQIIMSGLRKEKKITEMTMREVKNEGDYLMELKEEVQALREELKNIRGKV